MRTRKRTFNEWVEHHRPQFELLKIKPALKTEDFNRLVKPDKLLQNKLKKMGYYIDGQDTLPKDLKMDVDMYLKYYELQKVESQKAHKKNSADAALKNKTVLGKYLKKMLSNLGISPTAYLPQQDDFPKYALDFSIPPDLVSFLWDNDILVAKEGLVHLGKIRPNGNNVRKIISDFFSLRQINSKHSNIKTPEQEITVWQKKIDLIWNKVYLNGKKIDELIEKVNTLL